MDISEAEISAYLGRYLDRPVQLKHIEQLSGKAKGAAALKAFGYGQPVAVTYQVDAREAQVVIRRVKRNGFGRERDSDRVAEIWRDYHTFNKLPRHVKVLDMLYVDAAGSLHSLDQARELFLLTDYAPGRVYADDLLNLGAMPQQWDLARQRAKSMAVYLAAIHAVKHDDALLWRRRLRDLVGHGEGIMGLTDSYRPDDPVATPALLRSLEVAANRWRWRLKPLQGRLSQVHGDFHPFNILFTTETDFALLDRSRGEWGEPADDVSCLMINYLFFSLQKSGSLAGIYRQLYELFWATYLEESQDEEVLQVIAPWIAWRTLVLASPQWYPSLSPQTRRKLFNLARNVMAAPAFAWRTIEQYLEET